MKQANEETLKALCLAAKNASRYMEDDTLTPHQWIADYWHPIMDAHRKTEPRRKRYNVRYNHWETH